MITYESSTIDLPEQKSLFAYLPAWFRNRLLYGKTAWLVSLICGALIPLAFAPFNTYSSVFAYLIFFPLAIFLYQIINTCNARQAFYRGGLFGIGLFSVGVSWLYVAIHDFGAAHWSLAGAFTGIFIIFLAIFYALFALSIFKIRQQKNISHVLLCLFFVPLLWVLFEWLRSWLFTGFPWLLVGYPLIATPLSGFAPLLGIYGLSLLVIFLAAVVIAKIHCRISLSLILLVFILGSVLSGIQWSQPVGEPLTVALVQGNVNQTVKWDRWQLEKTKQLYVAMSQPLWQDNDLIVWPENAIPVFYHQLASGFYHSLDVQARKTQTELITGLPVFDDNTQQYYNSMTNLGGQQSYYYKTHLVPFGEYVPLAALIRGIILFFDMPMSGFSAGTTEQAPVIIKGHKVLITLCYEDVFPQDMIAHVPRSQFMINLSNNGWYGDSFAPHQHLEMARMRALETGREIIRSTTSGISAFIDAQGKVTVQGPQFKRAVIKGQVQPRSGITPYVFWGNYPIIILFIIMLIVLYRAGVLK